MAYTQQLYRVTDGMSREELPSAATMQLAFDVISAYRTALRGSPRFGHLSLRHRVLNSTASQGIAV